jgi:PST family polysaccharide transporter
MVGLNLVGLIKGFLVAGFLSASDYGVWGILLLTLTTILWLKEAGVSDKFVQQTESDQQLAFQKAFTVELVFTALLALILLAAVPVIALVYGRSELLAPGIVVALMVPAGALAAPIWVFYREMEFVKQRSLQAIDPIVGFTVTIALAAAGDGYWSLVIGAAAGTWASAAAALIASPYPLRIRFDRAALRDYFRFSWPVLTAVAGGAVMAQGSVFAGERILGLAGAGAITLASSVAAYAQRVDQVVTATLYPAICAVVDRRDLLLEAFVKSNRLAMMWGIPFGVGLTLFADDLVRFGIGERWRPAIVLLQAFGVIAAVNHIGFNWTAFYRARGETRPLAIVTVAATVVFLAVAVPLLATHGLGGFGLGMAAVAAASLALRLVYLRRLFPGFRLGRHALRAIAPTVPGAALVLLVRFVAGMEQSTGAALLLLAAFAGVTLAATLAFERRLIREVLGYLRRAPATSRVAG